MGVRTLCVLLLALCASTRVIAQTSNTTNTDTISSADATSTTETTPATGATTTGTPTGVTLDDTDSALTTPTTLTDIEEPATTPSTPTVRNPSTPSIRTPSTPSVRISASNSTTTTPTDAALSPTTRTSPATTPTPTPTSAPTPTNAALTPPPAARTPVTEAPTAGSVTDETDQTTPASPNAPGSNSEPIVRGNGGISADTGNSSSSKASSWLVPVVVATVVVLALLVITYYVRTRKRDDHDDLDGHSDIFFEAPRSNMNNYASATGDSGNNGLPAEELAQKGVVKAMRKDPTVTAASAAVPPVSSKMHSDSVTSAPTLARNRQDSTPIIAEPRFTLQQQVAMEQLHPSKGMTGVPSSPQVTTSPVGRPLELASMEAGSSYDSTPGVSAQGVTL